MRRRARRSGTGRSGQSVVVRIQQIANISYTSSFSFSVSNVAPSLFNRASYFRQLYEEYRLKSLVVKALPSCTGPVALGFLPTNKDSTTLTGLSSVDVLALEGAKLWWPNQTMPITIRPRISSVYNWLRCDNSLGYAGGIIIGGPVSTAVTCYLEIDAIFEFRGPVSYGLGLELKAPAVTSDSDRQLNPTTAQEGTVAVVPAQAPPQARAAGAPPASILQKWF